MNKIVAVENNLNPFKDFLAAQGCQIIPVEQAAIERVDAVVLSGADENLMGMMDIKTDAPVINASGRTPEQVWNDIQRFGQS